MKRDIEDIIKDNLHKFEAAELPEGFLHNFEKRLDIEKKPDFEKKTMQKRRHTAIFAMVASFAAAAIAVLMVVLHTPPEVSDIQKEMENIEAYYQNRELRTIEIIDKLLENTDPETRVAVRSELFTMQIEDAEYRNKRRGIITDERYLAFEVQYYDSRQQTLEYIQKILSK